MADVYSDFARVYDELMDNAPIRNGARISLL